MLPAILTAVYAALVSLIVPRLAANPRSRSPDRWAPTARTFLVAPLMGFLLMAVHHLLGPADGLVFDAFTALFVTGRALWVVRRWRTFYRELEIAIESSDDTMSEALLALRHPPISKRAATLWMVRIMQAALRAHELGRSDRALRWLGAIDPNRLTEGERIAFFQARIALAISLGQIELARETMRHVPQSIAIPMYREAVTILRALLVAIDGSDVSDERLEETRAARKTATGNSLDGWMAVEAHLLAARGDTIGAIDVLRGLKARVPPQNFERIARHGGPASPLASRLHLESPYR